MKKEKSKIEPEVTLNLNGKTLWQGTVEDFKKRPAALKAAQRVLKLKKPIDEA